MKTITYNNRIAVTFTAHKDNANAINAIISKYNGQSGLYDNSIGGEAISNDRLSIIASGPTIGGTVVFHSNQCDPAEAASELIKFLEPILGSPEKFVEITKTHRENGVPYKFPQSFIEKI